MGKTRTIWQFVCALFPSTWRTLSPDAHVYQDSGHTQTSRICHIFVLSLLVSRSTLPRNAFFLANAKLPNRPGFALFTGGLFGELLGNYLCLWLFFLASKFRARVCRRAALQGDPAREGPH